MNNLLKYEKELYQQDITLIAGVDEVGRGPLVGPVVAAAVILPVNYSLLGLTDSKQLSEKKRDEFYKIIMKEAVAVGIGVVEASEIDKINILNAAKLAMLKAVNNLKVAAEYLLIDGNQKINSDLPQRAIIKGDALSLSIAAASVIAKVTRDGLMYELHAQYPEYGFADHKGYATKKHLEKVKKFGPLDNYRFTFRPVSNLIHEGDKDEIRKTNI